MRNFIKDLLLGILEEVKNWLKVVLGAVVIGLIIFLAAWLAPIDWSTHWSTLNGK